CQQHNSHPYSF
nr:immunoglobulin light chain junction region [Macaca mulatta]MOW12160.1 immunoglobulin light chain junction region [Macaca mulatta]MOW65369.1 immunoglobulin light chain junction region [Macaca mulatta]